MAGRKPGAAYIRSTASVVATEMFGDIVMAHHDAP
jgi:hypothetical protein